MHASLRFLHPTPRRRRARLALSTPTPTLLLLLPLIPLLLTIGRSTSLIGPRILATKGTVVKQERSRTQALPLFSHLSPLSSTATERLALELRRTSDI